jgi:hypothetical protein
MIPPHVQEKRRNLIKDIDFGNRCGTCLGNEERE